MKLPGPISDYFGQWLAQRRGFGYILVDPDGRVLSWGGNLQHLGVRPLREGQAVAEQLILMEGVLPLTEPAIQIPMVRLDEDHALDVHVFKIDEGYGLLLMDASMDAHKQGLFQQKANESALVMERRGSLQEARPAPSDSGLFENFFLACNSAALQLGPDGRFSPIGRFPDWLHRFCPEAAVQPCCLNPENYFSFLDNFLREAHDFWTREEIGGIKSGLWIELDENQNEHLFEATALNTGRSKILIIAKERSDSIEKQDLIQKGREIALDHWSLKKRQSELRTARDYLEIRVRERTRQVEQMDTRLAQELDHRKTLENERSEMMLHLQQAQKMEAIGTLAGGIAHDFNNILSAVMGFTELSLLDVPKGSQLETNLKQVLSAGIRAKKLIGQILTFSRQSNPETQPIRLIGIVQEAVELLRASLPATIEIEQDLQSDAWVTADPSQLHQVVMNLCTNASQAMQPDGGVLKLTLRDRDVRPAESPGNASLPPGSYVEMAISDSGLGMSQETLKRIFDPFFTTKKKGEGTGLGLSVVHGIVKNSKGDIFVSSEIGRGTTFRILLPTTPDRSTAAIALQSQLPTGNERILYVDDEPAQTDLALKFLKPLGYRVIALTDSTLALQAFKENPDQFDLVLTDLYMPKITGKILSAEIKKIRPDLPVIICSGYNERVVDPASPGHKVDGYLTKPFSMKELASTIRTVLNK
jgi:signal transduction histidine kinase